MMRPTMRRLLMFGFFLLSAALWLSPLIPNPTGVAFQPGAQHSDLLISHLPNAIFLKRSLQTWGQIPLWNPMILSGAPFAADPLSGVFYPPNWLLLILPLSLGFNLLLWLHLAFAGFGIYRLLRDEGVGMPGAVLAGLAFGGLPKLVGHVGLGHVSLVFAVSWTPWILLAVNRALRAEPPGRWRDAALAGASLGIVFLADPRWALPASVLAAAYAARIIAHSHRDKGIRWRKVGTSVGWVVLFGVGISAALAIPLMQFARLSTRAALSAGEQAALSMPVGHLFGIILPYVGGYAEWLTYVGMAVLLLAVMAMIVKTRDGGFWLGTALVALVLALGEHTPLFAFLSAIPGFDLLRVPPRWLFVFGFALAMLAGRGLDALLKMDGVEKLLRSARLTLAAYAIFFLLLCAGVVWIGLRNPGVPWQTWTLFAAWGVVSALWGLAGLAMRIRPRWLAAGWILLVALDLACMNASLLEVKSLENTFEQPAFLTAVLENDTPQGRIFSPSYSLPQQIVAEKGLELADGVNPLQLNAYSQYMAGTTGFSMDDYSVTLPPFSSGDPREDWLPEIDTQRLGFLNVSWVASGYALNSEDLILEQVMDGIYLYSNPHTRPRAWVESDLSARESSWNPVESIVWTPNHIHLSAAGPGRLVLSEINYPGWMAEVDGESAEVETAHEVLRSVELPAGEHEVSFHFRPWTIYLGAGLSLLTLIALAVLWVRS
ncbi:MAG TPA: YfhO family protein [Anaerolineae bacterium]|nr:YfhO family protein [Anaerolineae bacterium]